VVALSYCVPIRNRVRDFEKALPSVLTAAERADVEIVVLDYGSTDNLGDMIASLPLAGETVHRLYYDRPHFHMAHARNLSILSARGAYVTSSNADTLVSPEFFEVIRTLAETGATVMRARRKRYNGVLTFKKAEFVAAGGFDERFEFYGPEDKDLSERFERRRCRTETFDSELISYITTPEWQKREGYRLDISTNKMAHRMHKVYDENVRLGRLTVNDGIEWGKW